MVAVSWRACRRRIAVRSARSLADAFGLGAMEAADLVVRMGSYPGAYPLRNDVGRWVAYVRDGAWVENACLAHAWNAGQRVSYWRDEPLEIDGVFEGTWGPWAVEVKTGAFQLHDLKALLEFVRRNPQFRPLVICPEADRATATRAGVPSMAWQDFLLGDPRGAS